ncbi:TetR family transcriptional regulator [Clostridium sporogenes]|uniref:TetR family transcriptional regulator n=1 Tax=Clostridium sporogenes TaxID=1509 RepID=A0ABD6S169_CLOSG|nr:MULTISPECIES: TetR/AcrR family transcriptional regulator [Clostridium]APF27303.1 bacterial regulatory s, tetR family protein [Clostridium sporogenes]EDU36568.1 transcriptional regulator, TetR family [Clostridium sporogenes ATCC 15579]MBU5300345.1 TetR/AcrR family transcriptional regulator [Clostridium sporogenes]MDI6918112.1 TetR/AcrR family transcriptional regulator [Clostridium botulinum]NFE68540.1 TetR/AcrR family transcriptional regulator [Clostridium sporogenes]
MASDTYHHGDLKESLIIEGLKLFNEEGADKFSLRKVAALCNVSHSAPYKHFKNKEELINAISQYVFGEFEKSLREIAEMYKDDPYKKIMELGKKYVWFMVENPDYLKFLFLNNYKYEIIVDENKLETKISGAFGLFKNSAIEYLKSINVKREEYAQDVIAMWSMVHGIAVMLANRTFIYNGDYLELVENIIHKNLKF